VVPEHRYSVSPELWVRPGLFPVPKLTVLSGPSGVGKGTVVAAVRRRHPDVWISVSMTTRPPRPGEVDGEHYFFVDDAEFSRLAQSGQLLEYATYGGHRYGTPREPVLRRLAAGRPALLEIDLQGARQVRAAMPEAQLIFLAPPDWEELVRRLTGRATESAEAVAERLALARFELAAGPEFDRQLINDNIDAVADQLVALMVE
jgi:guanylate kinase